MAQYKEIYRNINKDITIGNYTANDFILPFAVFILSMLFEFSILGKIISFGLSLWAMILLKELNETKLKGYYKAVIWWFGLDDGNFKTFPKSHEREFWR